MRAVAYALALCMLSFPLAGHAETNLAGVGEAHQQGDAAPGAPVSSGQPEEGPRVELFTPEGTIKHVRQVTANFSAPMVPFGDPRGMVDPFDIVCPEEGTARWADGKHWIFDFKRDLAAGVRCKFTLKAGLKTLAGHELSGTRSFSFSTGGPAVKWSQPREGTRYIDEEQAFVLGLDGEADEQSVVNNVFFHVDGIESRIGIRILTGAERKAVLRSVAVHKKSVSTLVIQAQQRFPSEQRVSLIWGAGVRSKSGVATDESQTIEFRTRGPFQATFSCDRSRADEGCLPFSAMNLNFSAPVPVAQASKVILRGTDGTVVEPVLAGVGSVTLYMKNGVIVGVSSRRGSVPGTGGQKSPDPEELKNTMIEGVIFKGPFPERSSYRIELPAKIVDEAGRKLSNADRFPLAVSTVAYPPLAKFPASFGILESKADPILPLTVRNVEPQITTAILPVAPYGGLGQQLQRLSQKLMGKIMKVPSNQAGEILTMLKRVETWNQLEYDTRTRSIFSELAVKPQTRTIPKPHETKAMEVIGLPLPQPGLYIVEIESRILGTALLAAPAPMYVATAALVTNLSVHFKEGREASLVWVTALDSGRPVPDATVTVHTCAGNQIWTGQTDAQGLARIGLLAKAGQCESYRDEYFVMATLGDDMSFVRSTWQNGIEPWRFNLPSGHSSPTGAYAHTVFDRTLLRAGDTVHMKHVIRQPHMRGLSMLKDDARPKAVVIHHEATSQRYEFPVQWDAQGIAETAWTIPKDAKLGTYGIWLKKDLPKPQDKNVPDDHEMYYSPQGQRSGEFRVEEYRVPLMKGVIKGPLKPLVAVTEATVDLAVKYLAGGPAGHLPVKFRSQVQPKGFIKFDGFEGATFANGAVTVGLSRERQRDYMDWRDAVEEGEAADTSADDEGAGRPSGKKKPPQSQSSDLVLDDTGGIRTTLSKLPNVTVPMDIATELEFRDPNGEVQTVAATIPIWPSQRMVGLKPDSWAATSENVKFQAIVVDLSGKPVAGVPVAVEMMEKKTYSHRKRLLGGFYAYEHVTDIKSVGKACEGKTDSRGIVHCDVRARVSGNVILQARAADEKGHPTVANTEVWIRGESDWWYGVGDDDRMDLLPERPRYEPGETAKFQVRMPFREATALITVEREGVIDAYVQPLSGKNPVVELPIADVYAPNVFVSVLAVRGRVGDVQPTAMVDLGRPAYKLGIAGINVGWRAHELKVQVASNSEVYRVREKARITVAVKRADGGALPAGSEIALAAVDEGLLQLMPNQSWQILTAMMRMRNEEVSTSTAQMHVVGKRHFGLKAKPHGGGGGKEPTRELFDTLLLWKGRVLLNEKGEASVEVPLNDSITSFRIAVVATGGSSFFGTGSTSIRSTQELMMFSGTAPLVREGDRYRSEFTVRNASNKPMQVTLSGRVTPLPAPLTPLTVALVPGEAKNIGWDLTAPVGVEQLVYEVEAVEKGGSKDRMKIVQKVVPAVPVRTFQATIAQLSPDVRFPIERPGDAIPGRGDIAMTVRASLVDGLGGVSEYMSRYPYSCLEQQVSKAVALRDDKQWQKIMNELPSYLDANGLAKYWPGMRWGSDVLTSYLLAIAHEAGWTIPSGSLDRMSSGLTRFVGGSVEGYSPLNTSDFTIRKLAAIEALSRYDKAHAAMLDSVTIDPNLWPTSAVIDWSNIVGRVDGIKNRDARAKESQQILRSRLNFQGTTMGFSTEHGDQLWWLMTSNDTNAVRLVLAELASPQWKEDMPRIVRGAIGRQAKGHWDLTTANAWGMLAVEKFAAAFEQEPVTGTTVAAVATQSDTIDWSKDVKGAVRSFPWPEKQAELSVQHRGTGKPWLTVQSRAAIPLTEPLSSGYRIGKTLTPLTQKRAGMWSQGDVARVRLEIESQADMTWVVVNDPVPGGASILGGVGREKQLATQGEEQKGWVWPAYEERAFDAFRSYYAYVPKGTFTVEYTVRFNQIGTYQLPSTRVEAMYSPEMFGEIPNKVFEVNP